MYDQYNPYGYQQFGPPNMQMPQNNYMQPRPTAPAMDVAQVQTIQQVEQVGLQPGQRKIVMVQNEPVVALRVADPISGLVDTKYYNLVEIDPRAMRGQPSANYVTAEQLESRLSELLDSLKPTSRGKRETKEATE